MKKIALLLSMVAITVNAKKIETKQLTDSQEKRSTKMGQTTLEELKMVQYDRDTIAGAVVLYEHVNYYTSAAHNYQSKTDFY